MAYATPTRTRQRGGTTFTYELTGRIHSTCVYPLCAPNGSTVLLYAQDEGISVLWRGGRALKQPKPTNTSGKPNGTTKHDDSVMIIDSDDDEPDTDPAPELVDYDDELDDSSLGQPDRIVAHTFVEIDATPLHLAVPPLCRSATAHNVQYAPKYCCDNAVVAAACADGSVRLITIPIAPTHNQSRKALEDIPLCVSHRTFKAPGPVSLSFASRDYANYNLDKLTDPGPITNRDEEWDMLVAWHISNPVPAIGVAQVPIEAVKGHSRLGIPRHQIYHLPSPLHSLSFNPALRQLNRPKQILMADSDGLVRICELTFTTKTSASGVIYHELSRSPNWTATFYVPFADSLAKSNGSTSSVFRKRILDAQWAVDGRCIITLLGDGSWGLWDLEGAQPQLSGAHQVASHTTGVYGGGVTQFSLRGSLTTKSALSTKVPEKSKSTREKSFGDKRLAPMTPNTRKATQHTFLDKIPRLGIDTSRAFRGGISVSRLSEPAPSAPYETIIFWLEDGIHVIPNIMLYWQRAIQNASGGVVERSNTGTVVGPVPASLGELSTLGEAVTSLVQFPAYNDLSLASHSKLQHDFVIAAEHRLIFYCPTKSQEGTSLDRQKSLTTVTQTEKLSGPSLSSDEQLLARGELGLAGLDRLMDGMETNTASGDLFPQAERPRRVGFATGP